MQTLFQSALFSCCLTLALHNTKMFPTVMYTSCILCISDELKYFTLKVYLIIIKTT